MPKKIFIDLKKVKILKPITRPPKIIAIGLNYADHLDEIRFSGRKNVSLVLIFLSIIAPKHKSITSAAHEFSFIFRRIKSL